MKKHVAINHDNRYVVDVDTAALKASGAPRLRPRPGQCERIPVDTGDLLGTPAPRAASPAASRPTEPVVVVGR